MTILNANMLADPALVSIGTPADPRTRMAARLPAFIQPFLTWLTAKPAPGEVAPGRSATAFILGALAWTFGGCLLAAVPLALASPPLLAWLLLPAGLLATCCGLGLFQVVVFHHCSHGTVLKTREANRRAGRLISALLLFKRFEDYQREHMMHHSPNKLLTEEDEFADFVMGMCGLEPWRSEARAVAPGARQLCVPGLPRPLPAAPDAGQHVHRRPRA
ncbi:fatty acid desaturase [Dankookia sp. P2]|uniref:fatty acid desaturase n=1 Tax=Dankookia sp. P2 TaxID=3423955 RepID=UPI003D678741